MISDRDFIQEKAMSRQFRLFRDLTNCLAATNLGMQYIFISERAVSQAKILERCYISANEREYYKNIRLEEAVLGDNKVKLARRQYRGKGQYIDDILEE